MIDLHSHILPGIDDGSKSVEMSLEMLRKSAAQGVKTIFATPHFYATRHTPQRFFEKRQSAWEQLQPMLEEGMPKVILGAEVTYFEGMSRSQELENMRLGDSNLLLVEMPTTPWTDYMIEELECIPSHLGLQPVLAHIDRYMHRSQLPRFLDDLLELEVLLQANADAFGSFLHFSVVPGQILCRVAAVPTQSLLQQILAKLMGICALLGKGATFIFLLSTELSAWRAFQPSFTCRSGKECMFSHFQVPPLL